MEEKHLDLSQLNKQKIVIDGDENRVLYLNLSDNNIIIRYKEKYEELNNLGANALKKLKNTQSINTKEDLTTISDTLKDIDNQIKTLIDYIFDANVCEVCIPFGSMIDLVNGKFRYEILVEAISELYEDNLNAEFKKLRDRINTNSHTKKYVKKVS